MIKKIYRIFIKPFRMPADQRYITFLLQVLNNKLNKLSAAEALKLLLKLDAEIYKMEGQQSVRYGNGIHTKHKHIRYHDFFVNNIEAGTTVLDIGSHTGDLTNDIALRAKPAKIIGIEIEKDRVKKAKEKYNLPNLEFIAGDATKDLPNEHFDIITMSNVLEHIEKRVEFLQTLIRKYAPEKILIRVPRYERDWRVPLKEELGIDYRLDPTHYIEYKQSEFFDEMDKAGLQVTNYGTFWGEIWAITKPY